MHVHTHFAYMMKIFVSHNACAFYAIRSGAVRILYLQSVPVRLVRSEKYTQPQSTSNPKQHMTVGMAPLLRY